MACIVGNTGGYLIAGSNPARAKRGYKRGMMKKKKKRKSLIGYTDNNASLALLDWFFTGNKDEMVVANEFIFKKRRIGSYRKVRITIEEI